MNILGFGCKAQVGKDTAGEYLTNKYPNKSRRVAFADKVKEVTMDLFDLSYEQCYGSKEVKETVDLRYNKTPREIMQKVGESLRRHIGEDVWVDAVFNVTIPQALAEGAEFIVITDVRYPNEGDRIRQESGSVIRVDRAAGGTSVGADHPSEVSMNNYQFDFVIENNGSVGDFYKALDQLVEEIDHGRTEGGN